MVLVVVAYFTFILRFYFLSLMGIITVVVVIVFAFLTIVAVVVRDLHQQKLAIRRSSMLFPLLPSQVKATGPTNIPILFVFMICNRRFILNKG